MNKQQDDNRNKSLTRRRFLAGSAAAAGCSIVPSSVLGQRRGQGAKTAPSKKLNIAGLELGARGLGNMEKCVGANIVALCDVDWTLAATAMKRYPDAAKYRDFRRMSRGTTVDASRCGPSNCRTSGKSAATVRCSWASNTP